MAAVVVKKLASAILVTSVLTLDQASVIIQLGLIGMSKVVVTFFANTNVSSLLGKASHSINRSGRTKCATRLI